MNNNFFFSFFFFLKFIYWSHWWSTWIRSGPSALCLLINVCFTEQVRKCDELSNIKKLLSGLWLTLLLLNYDCKIINNFKSKLNPGADVYLQWFYLYLHLELILTISAANKRHHCLKTCLCLRIRVHITFKCVLTPHTFYVKCAEAEIQTLKLLTTPVSSWPLTFRTKGKTSDITKNTIKSWTKWKKVSKPQQKCLNRFIKLIKKTLSSLLIY